MSWFNYQSPEVIERCQGVAGELQLQRRGNEYEIIYNGVFLMATYNGASEKAAVREALELVITGENKTAKVLMGGLGVGYSLSEALKYKQVAYVSVAEIEPVVVRWNREILTGINDDALSDPRVGLFSGDFKDLLKKEAQAAARAPGRNQYQVVMVDTDNGSAWLSLPENAYLYKQEGLRLIDQCLAPGGVACFWCANEDENFAENLRERFKKVVFRAVSEQTGLKGAYYLACKQSANSA